MQVLITPKITLQTSNKLGRYEITAQLQKKDLGVLTVRICSHNKKDKRIIGSINRTGDVELKKNKYAQKLLLTHHNQHQIDTLLDLIYGSKRDKFPTINKDGYVHFKK